MKLMNIVGKKNPHSKILADTMKRLQNFANTVEQYHDDEEREKEKEREREKEKEKEKDISDEEKEKKTGKETGKKILKVFKNLVEINAISVEVQKVTKDKNRKNVSQFIDYLNKTKTLDIAKTIVEKSLKNIKKKDGGLKRTVTKKTTVQQHNFGNALRASAKKQNQNQVEDVKETKNETKSEAKNETKNETKNEIKNENKKENKKETKKEKGSDLNKTVSGRKTRNSLADEGTVDTRERKNSGNALGKKLKTAFFGKKK